MKLLIENKIFTLLLVFVIISSQIIPSFGVATVSISPTSGNVGSTETLSGSGWQKSTFSTKSISEVSNSLPYSQNVNLNFFGGLTANSVLTKYRLNTNALGSGQYTYSIPETVSFPNFWESYVNLIGISLDPTQTNIIDQNSTLNFLRLNIQDLGNKFAEFVKTITETASNSNSWNGTTNYEFFSGLDSNAIANIISLNIATHNGNIRFMIYDDNGSSGCGSNHCPKNQLYSGSDNALTTTGFINFTLGNTTVPTDGNIWVAWQQDSFQSALVDGIQSNTCSNGSWNAGFHNIAAYGSSPPVAPSVSCGTGFASNSGATLPNEYLLPAMKLYWTDHTPHIRVKVYNADGPAGCLTGTNCAGSILYDGSRTTVVTTGAQNFTLGGVRMPSNGKAWIGWEVDSNMTTFVSGAQGAGSCANPYQFQKAPHLFGAGPNPAGTTTCGIDVVGAGHTDGMAPDFRVYWTEPTPEYRIKVYKDDGASGCGSNNCPSTEIYDGPPTNIVATGATNYTLGNTLVPADGNVWIGFETPNFETSIVGGAQASSCTPATWNGGFHIVHTFGSGPNPAGSTGCGLGFNSNYFEPDQVVYYSTPSSTGNVTLKWDGVAANPNLIYTDEHGGFSGQSFVIPSSTTTNPHVLNATDKLGNKATANFNITVIDPTFSEWLHDMSAQILSGHIVQTYSGGTPVTQTLNGTGWASFAANAGQQYNYTLWDNANDFQVYKLINNSTTTGFTDKQPVWEWPFNCINPFTGFQSDFIFQQNDTDGHHITSMTQPVCLNQDEVKYNVTYAANGTSNTSYNGLTRIVEGGSSFQPNPTTFNVNGTSIGTVSTTGVDILSNAYSIGSGLKTILNEFDIIFQKTGTGAGAGSSGGPSLVGNNATCFAGVYNTQTNQCQFGLVGFNVTAPIITINPTNTSSTTINLQCSGAQYLTINNVNLGSNPLGLQIYGLPTTINCGTQPSSCPSGTTLQNGQCVGNPVCPISSQLSNGVCVGTMSCPAGTTMQNGQCLAPAVCSNGAMPVNGQCPNSGNVTLIAPPNPNGTNNCSINNISACVTNNNNTCSITNPLACFTGTTQTEPATITGTTSNGQIVSAKTIITALQSPELNIVSLIFILLILAAIVGGVIYRHYKGKEKKKKHRSNGKDNSIRKFNENLRKK